MELALTIIAILAMLTLASWIRIKRTRRNTSAIIMRFREQGAIKKNKAKTLTEMGLHSKPTIPFLLRDERMEALSQLLRKGIICQAEEESDTEEARFYLDEQNHPLL